MSDTTPDITKLVTGSGSHNSQHDATATTPTPITQETSSSLAKKTKLIMKKAHTFQAAHENKHKLVLAAKKAKVAAELPGATPSTIKDANMKQELVEKARVITTEAKDALLSVLMTSSLEIRAQVAQVVRVPKKGYTALYGMLSPYYPDRFKNAAAQQEQQEQMQQPQQKQQQQQPQQQRTEQSKAANNTSQQMTSNTQQKASVVPPSQQQITKDSLPQSSTPSKSSNTTATSTTRQFQEQLNTPQSEQNSGKILFIGGGNMCTAIVAGLLNSSLYKPEELYVVEKSQAQKNKLQQMFNLRNVFSPDQSRQLLLDEDIRHIILAVKPGVVSEVLKDLVLFLDSKKHIVTSLAAGVTTQDIYEYMYDKPVPVIRVMPNTPSMIQLGAAGLCKGKHATHEHMQDVLSILERVGIAIEVTEDQIGAVTGVSGSGPAFVINFIENMTAGGVLAGLSFSDARRLAIATVHGTSKMLLNDEHINPAVFRESVCSPAGTTIVGMKTLADMGFASAVQQCVLNAALWRGHAKSQLPGSVLPQTHQPQQIQQQHINAPLPQQDLTQTLSSSSEPTPLKQEQPKEKQQKPQQLQQQNDIPRPKPPITLKPPALKDLPKSLAESALLKEQIMINKIQRAVAETNREPPRPTVNQQQVLSASQIEKQAQRQDLAQRLKAKANPTLQAKAKMHHKAIQKPQRVHKAKKITPRKANKLIR